MTRAGAEINTLLWHCIIRWTLHGRSGPRIRVGPAALSKILTGRVPVAVFGSDNVKII